jgi:hypothetical protein
MTMTSPFDAFDASLSAATVQAFGEVALLRPRVSSQYAERAADEDRHQQAVTGIFSAGPADSSLKGSASSGNFAGTTRLATLTAAFWIAADAVATLSARPVKGDTITLTGRDGCPVYTITRVEPSDRGDLNFILVREDQPE